MRTFNTKGGNKKGGAENWCNEIRTENKDQSSCVVVIYHTQAHSLITRHNSIRHKTQITKGSVRVYREQTVNKIVIMRIIIQHNHSQSVQLPSLCEKEVCSILLCCMRQYMTKPTTHAFVRCSRNSVIQFVRYNVKSHRKKEREGGKEGTPGFVC